MGLRGPKRTPTKILQLRGSGLAKHRHDPQAPLGRPPAPRWLNPEEKRVFLSLTDALDRMGILATVDGALLGRYSVLFALWERASKVIMTLGETYLCTDRAGQTTTRVRPEARCMLDYHKELVKIEASFGLTPASRSTLGGR